MPRERTRLQGATAANCWFVWLRFIFIEKMVTRPLFLFPSRPVHPFQLASLCNVCGSQLFFFLFSFCQFWSSSNWNDSSSNTHTPNCFFFLFFLILLHPDYVMCTLYYTHLICRRSLVCVCVRRRKKFRGGERERKNVRYKVRSDSCCPVDIHLYCPMNEREKEGTRRDR